MAYAWGDIEEGLDELRKSDDEDFSISAGITTSALKKAFRVEARCTENGFGDPCTVYAVLFDVADSEARQAARGLESERGLLGQGIRRIARPWHSRDYLEIIQVPRSTPVQGQICRRQGEDHPASVSPSLDDVPTFTPSGGTIPLETRGPYYLTPSRSRSTTR